jgi:hypothetical protein
VEGKRNWASCTPPNFNARMHVLKNKALLQLYNKHQEIKRRSVSKVGCPPLALSLTSSARQTRSTKEIKNKNEEG